MVFCIGGELGGELGGERVQVLVRGMGGVAPPGLGTTGGVLQRRALPARRKRTLEAGSPGAIGFCVAAKIGGVLLAEPQLFGCQGIERRDLGMVGIAEAHRGDGT